MYGMTFENKDDLDGFRREREREKVKKKERRKKKPPE